MASNSRGSIVLAGASTVGRGTPWGTLCEIVAKALESFDYECTIETRSLGQQNGRYVGDGRADVGAWYLPHLVDAYEGKGAFASEGPRENLRVIAHINHPVWIAIAVRSEAGLNDLAAIADERRPTRIRTGPNQIVQILFEYYGLSNERLETFGGWIKPAHEVHSDAANPPVEEPELVTWVVEGDFDLIVDSVYSGVAPEISHWAQATDRYDLNFLPMPDAVIDDVCERGLGSRSQLPHRLMRGIWHDVPTVLRPGHAIYCRSETPDQVVADVARSLDEHRQLFRECHLAYSYDPANVALHFGVPYHPAALAYYESVGIAAK